MIIVDLVMTGTGTIASIGPYPTRERAEKAADRMIRYMNKQEANDNYASLDNLDATIVVEFVEPWSPRRWRDACGTA